MNLEIIIDSMPALLEGMGLTIQITLLVQLFLIYYSGGQFRAELESVGLWSFFREAYFCAIFSLALNTAGYTAGTLRGAIRAVPVDEIVAAKACGMRGILLYRRIKLPKAFRLAI